MCKESKIVYYLYDIKNTKWLVILNHENFQHKPYLKRNVNREDVGNLVKQFSVLECNIVVYHDLTVEEISKLPSEIEKLLGIPNAEALIFVILSRADTKDGIMANCAKTYNLYEFMKKFDAENFKTFENKQVLFLISAFREGAFETLHNVNVTTSYSVCETEKQSTSLEKGAEDGLPNVSINQSHDMTSAKRFIKNSVILFGTMDDTISNDLSPGTLFITSLCEVLERFVEMNENNTVEITCILEDTFKIILQERYGNFYQLPQFGTVQAPIYFKIINN